MTSTLTSTLTSTQLTSTHFTLIFLIAVGLSLMLHIWLAMRQLRHVAAHRSTVPKEFAGRIELAEHHKAADYTCAKARLSIVSLLIGTAVLLAFTSGGLHGIVFNGRRANGQAGTLARDPNAGTWAGGADPRREGVAKGNN